MSNTDKKDKKYRKTQVKTQMKGCKVNIVNGQIHKK